MPFYCLFHWPLRHTDLVFTEHWFVRHDIATFYLSITDAYAVWQSFIYRIRFTDKQNRKLSTETHRSFYHSLEQHTHNIESVKLRVSCQSAIRGDNGRGACCTFSFFSALILVLCIYMYVLRRRPRSLSPISKERCIELDVAQLKDILPEASGKFNDK